MRRVALCAALVVVLQSGPACAVTVTRLFEPTDLEFEDPGVAELDLQFGPVRGQSSYRVSMADFEFDLGLTKTIEPGLAGGDQWGRALRDRAEAQALVATLTRGWNSRVARG